MWGYSYSVTGYSDGNYLQSNLIQEEEQNMSKLISIDKNVSV